MEKFHIHLDQDLYTLGDVFEFSINKIFSRLPFEKQHITVYGPKKQVDKILEFSELLKDEKIQFRVKRVTFPDGITFEFRNVLKGISLSFKYLNKKNLEFLYEYTRNRYYKQMEENSINSKYFVNISNGPYEYPKIEAFPITKEGSKLKKLKDEYKNKSY